MKKSYYTVNVTPDSYRGTLVSSRAENLPEAMHKTFMHVAYYLREDSGHDAVVAHISATCARCDGLGAIPRNHSTGTKQCPDCKGDATKEITSFMTTRRDLSNSFLKIVDTH